jgi:aminotransferase
MMKIHQYVMMSAPTAGQHAAIEALKNGEEDVQGMLAEYDRRRRLVELLSRNGLAGRAARRLLRLPPSAAPAFGRGLCRRSSGRREGGSGAGVGLGEGGRGRVRICYAQRYDLLEEAMRRMGRFVSRYRTAAK